MVLLLALKINKLLLLLVVVVLLSDKPDIDSKKIGGKCERQFCYYIIKLLTLTKFHFRSHCKFEHWHDKFAQQCLHV